jgi:hypothetical protein
MTTHVLFREPQLAAEDVSNHDKESKEQGMKVGSPYPHHASAAWELVTPELARRYLDTMHDNRSESKLEVGVFADTIEEGTFYPAISPVFFDAGDPLLEEDRAWDGQHRFSAIEESGIAQHLLVIRGVTAEEAKVIDTGRARSFADTLRIGHVVDYSRQATVSRVLAGYAKYGIDYVRTPARADFPLTRKEKEVFVDSPGMKECISVGRSLARRGANISLAAYVVYRTADGTLPDGIDSDGFWNSVFTGEGLVHGDPALTLRDYLMSGGAKQRHMGGIDPRLMELYVLTTAWNKHVRGERWTKPNPVLETRNAGSSVRKYLPASQVPDVITLAERRTGLGRLRAAARPVTGGTR